jgi:signal transduction histidine kinase
VSRLALRAPRSLRARLVLWVGLIMAIVLVGFSSAVYAILHRSLSDQIAASLAERAQQVSRTVGQGGFHPRLHGREPPDIPPPETFSSADTFVQVSSLDGQILRPPFESSETTLPLPESTLARVRDGQSVYETVRIDGERVGVYSTPMSVRGQIIGVVQVGRSVGFADRALSQLRLLAGLGLLLALALAVLGVSLMTGATLRPLERLIHTAESVGSSRDLSRRVATPGSDDEVGRLAVTFNRMLSRLQASDAHLRETLESQRRFVADASHELRTPLTAIRGNAGMLRSVAEMSPEDRAESIEEIHREAERMSRLVGDLLALARADAGRELRREPVNLAALVRGVAAQAARLSDGREVAVDAQGPVAVAGDPDALRQLALILLDNAVKYTPPGGRITVRLDAGDGEARLTVADTGIGIAAEHLPHIFERFYQADPARTEGGTGLGLAIARWIAEQHGGHIEVDSTPGQGSTFTVSLPATPSDPSPSASPARQPSGSVTPAAARRA